MSATDGPTAPRGGLLLVCSFLLFFTNTNFSCMSTIIVKNMSITIIIEHMNTKIQNQGCACVETKERCFSFFSFFHRIFQFNIFFYSAISHFPGILNPARINEYFEIILFMSWTKMQ